MDTYEYILIRMVLDNREKLRLIRIRMREGAGMDGEQYFDGKWHRHPGALSYLPDPSPGDFIDELEAEEVMRQIDLGG